MTGLGNVLTLSLWSGGRDGSVPGGGLFCSRMSLVFTSHVLLDAHLFIDVEGNFMLQAACSKSSILVSAVSWCGQVPLWW